MLYATTCRAGEHRYSLSSQAHGGRVGKERPLTPTPTPTAFLSLAAVPLPCPGLASSTAQGGAASWASQPASAGCGWPTSSVPGPARAWLRWWSTDTRPAVLPSCGNLDPPRFVCTPASLLALPTQPHSTHPMHTHTHTHAFLSSELGYNN